MTQYIYTEDRETFEREMFAQRRLAIMFEHASYYTRRMSVESSFAFFEAARIEFWKLRNEIPNHGIFPCWYKALQRAAMTRPHWWFWFSTLPFWRAISGKRLVQLVHTFREP